MKTVVPPLPPRLLPHPPSPKPLPPDDVAIAINRFELTATLIQRDVIRYTPSGTPLIDCVLHHASEISEAGQLRQVELEAPAIAFESVAQRLANTGLDETYRFTGFVANRSRKSKRTVFHITEFNTLRDPIRE